MQATFIGCWILAISCWLYSVVDNSAIMQRIIYFFIFNCRFLVQHFDNFVSSVLIHNITLKYGKKLPMIYLNYIILIFALSTFVVKKWFCVNYDLSGKPSPRGEGGSLLTDEV